MAGFGVMRFDGGLPGSEGDFRVGMDRGRKWETGGELLQGGGVHIVTQI